MPVEYFLLLFLIFSLYLIGVSNWLNSPFFNNFRRQCTSRTLFSLVDSQSW
ncbi:unnamed protein product [Spirodela intermedia]|uniref:Uncharacterized protein n=1 Tax=Spirodela intermedia TaxID=51605 RepID=A0A7I8JPB8_SPIIN|nr:unnamed protein product [Spirodela intermedia]CAA6671292.1 unnamed protein product [Spirodela intermedia]